MEKYSLVGWSDGGITAIIMAAGYPDRVTSLVVWGANAFVTEEDAAAYEKIRDIDNWSDAMRKPFVDVYGEEYFRSQFSLWVDAIKTYVGKFNGKCALFSTSLLPVKEVNGDGKIVANKVKKVFKDKVHIYSVTIAAYAASEVLSSQKEPAYLQPRPQPKPAVS